MTRTDTHRQSEITFGFEPELITVPIAAILPVKPLRAAIKTSHKYRQIAASIREIGLVEAPVVARNGSARGSYLLLDGHLRVEVLKDLGVAEVECLVSTDDEAFTYNKRISRLAVVQEHRMIVKAVERGVPEERIARALALEIRSIRRKFKLLDGICSEAADLLKDKPCPMAVFEILKKMAPLQQVKAADLMIGGNNYSVNYANAILAATPQNLLADPEKPKKVKGVTPEYMASMEREVATLQSAIKSIEHNYGVDNLNMTVVRGYLTKLVGNGRVARYLMRHRPAFLTEFQNIAEMTSTLPQDAA